MSDWEQIIEEELAVSAEDFPSDPDAPGVWAFTDEELRKLLTRVAERAVEREKAAGECACGLKGCG